MVGGVGVGGNQRDMVVVGTHGKPLYWAERSNLKLNTSWIFQINERPAEVSFWATFETCIPIVPIVLRHVLRMK